MRGGTYNELVVITRSGTSSQWIMFRNYADELPVVDGSGITPIYWAGGIIQVSSASYIVIDGFKVQDSVASGICVLRSHNVTVQNCQTTNTGQSGIRVCYGEGTSSIKYCTDVNVVNNMISLSNTDFNQEALTFSGVNNSKIKYNTLASTCKKEGICCKNNCNNCTIAYNNLMTPGVSIYVGATDGGYSHIFWVYSNYCHGKGSSFCIGLEECGQSENFYIYNNIFASGLHGFNLIDEMVEGGCSTGPRNVYFINNVCDVGNTAIKINPSTTQTYIRNVVIRNNILKGSINSIFLGENQINDEIIVDHNLFTSPDNVYGTDYIIGDPKWVSESTGDYHLQSISPAIDAGSSIDAPPEDYEGNLRPRGEAVDIGAYEYVFNYQPNTPNTPDGSPYGFTGVIYNYITSTTDPDNDYVYYWFDWGDGTNSGWDGPYLSGDSVTLSHKWTSKGLYSIKVKAKDVYGLESKWSNPLRINMPKNKIYYHINILFLRVMQRFPFFEKILNQLV